MDSFANRLKELRQENNVTQKQVSELPNITERNYQRYEYGLVNPTATNCILLADYYQVSIDYLLGRSDVKWWK